MKMLKRTLAMMLALIMMFSAVPFNAYATESTDEPSVPTEAPVDAPETEEPAAEEPVVEDEVVEEPAEVEEVVEAPQSRAVPTGNTVEYKYNVFHLDAGRKYFSVDSIKALIDNIAAAGFNQMNLYLSDNQGFRFALDDMTITTSNGTYDLTPALGDGYSADSKYPCGTGKYLTQSEMDTIITYAHNKGIDIVPCINVPGHMGAILEEFRSFRYKKGSSTSKSSIDLANGEAVAFALALTEKYATYFASKGCKYYCVGADEYANDLSSMGFEGMGSTLYTKFVKFLNDAADIVIAKGMTPRAFNDGFYYKDYNISIEPNKAYQVYYWSSGWSGYDVATAATISAKGHEMINTHGDYYWVLGNSSWQCSATKASQFDETAFQGSTISDPAGSMFCIWCDKGNADSAANVIEKTKDVIAAFGRALPAVEALVSGVVTPDPEPEVPEDVGQPDAATGIVVTAPGLTGLTVTEATAPAIEGAAEGKVLAWDMTPATADGSYTGEATVAVPVPDGWDDNKMGAFVITDGAVKLLSGELNEAGLFQFTMPHFSVGGVYEIAPTAADTDLTLEINGVQEYTLDGHVGTEGTYTTEDGVVSYTVKHNTVTTEGSTTTTKATTLSNGEYIIGNGTQWLTLNGSALGSTTDASAATKWTVTSTNSGYTIRSGSNYLAWTSSTSSSMWSTTYSYKLSVSTTAQTWSYSSDSGFYSYLISSSSFMSDSSKYYYLHYNKGWKFETTNSSNGAAYTVTTTSGSASTSTTVTINGVKAGSTTVAVGSNVYNVTVNKGAYSATVTVGAYKTYTDSSSTYTVADSTVATATLNNGTLTITGVKVGTTTVTTENALYTVTVQEENLDDVTPLRLETWITNGPLKTSGTSSDTDTNADNDSYTYYYKEINATDDGINTEAGVAISSLTDNPFINSDGTEFIYWQSRYLTKARQDTAASNNQTAAGDSVVRIRYWNGSWQYQNASGTWVPNMTTKADDVPQLVSYYLQKTEVTDEITTLVVDYGNVPYNQSLSPFVLVDYAVKYESGERTPTSFPTSTTIAFHCDTGTGNLNKTVFKYGSTHYRRLGTIRAVETAEYEVYMITLTPTSSNATTTLASNANKVSSYSYDVAGTSGTGNEKVIWIDDEANLGVFADAANEGSALRYTSPSGNFKYTVGGEPDIPGLEVIKNQGMLVTYYVRAKATEDALTVHYVDETENLEFYHYNIAVTEGTKFDERIALNNSNPNSNLLNGTVTNFHNKTQTVSADLKTLSQVGSQYLYTEYNCVEVKRSDDGKHVYLYYTFDPTVYFVADFGLPMEITAAKLSDKLNGVEIEDMLFTGVANTKFGKLTDNGTTVTYTPNKILTGLDYFTLIVKTKTAVGGILDEAANQIAFRVYVTPATTVYYGEKFISFDGNWSTTGTDVGNVQQTEVLGSKSSHYGYDTAYNAIGASDGTSKTAIALGAKATFEFTGDGLQLFANCTEKSGNVSVVVKDKATKKTVNMTMVDTVVKGETNSQISGGQTGNLAGLPIISLVDLQNIPHSTYTVTITKILDSEDTVYIDGFRVFNTINETGIAPENSIYSKDLEDLPDFYEMRDAVLSAMNITIGDSEDYKTLYQQLHDAIVLTGETAVITSASAEYGANDRQDLLDNGPKNELYLFPGDTLTFNVKTDRAMQLGMKAPNAAVNAEVTVDGTTTTQAVSSSVDMFYQLKGDTTKAPHSISIKNSSNSGILSVTLLKICDDPSFAFAPLTEDNIKAILADAGYTDGTETPDEPEVPEETTKPTEPEVEETTKPSKPQKPSKPEKPGKPENTKPTEPQKPSKPGNNGNQKPGKEEKTYTLKITFVNLFGKKVGTATITTTNGVVSAYEINGKAPAGYHAIWLIPVTLRANGNTSVVVPVI